MSEASLLFALDASYRLSTPFDTEIFIQKYICYRSFKMITLFIVFIK